jgi:hypothetical protein
MWVGVGVRRDGRRDAERLACYDPASGAELGNYAAVAAALAATAARAGVEAGARAAAEKRAQAEARTRAAAEQRIRELEAKLKQSRRPGS